MAKKSTGKMGLRGLMFDPARLTEKHDFYFDMLPRLKKWGYNTIWWHFCDDEGCALRLSSFPEFTAPYAFSKAETRRLIEAAAAEGIDVVPEVETLGHSLWITGQPGYEHLFNGNVGGHNAICPSHPDTMKIMEKILSEVSGIFTSPFIHAGLDEAALEDCPRCRKKSKGKPRWWLLARHAKAIHSVIKGLGKRMIMWADAVENHPALLKVLPKDIVLAHWHYGEVHVEKMKPSIKAGFEIICVPAVVGGILSNRNTFKNNADMAQLVSSLSGKGCLGTVTCLWESFRSIRDAYMPVIAYAGKAMKMGKGPEPLNFMKKYLKDEHSIEDKETARAWWNVYSLVPERFAVKAFFPDSFVDFHEALKFGSEEDFDQKAEEAKTYAAVLKKALNGVRKNKNEFKSLLIAAQLVEAAYLNGCLFKQIYKALWNAELESDKKVLKDMSLSYLKKAASILEKTLKNTSLTAGKVSAEWDRTRYKADRKKDNSSPLIHQRGCKAILPTLLRSTVFLKKILKEFTCSVSVYEKGGGFPGGI